MLRVLLSFILTAFLFVGLISTANVMFASTKSPDVTVVAQVSEKKDKRQTIKEIEMESASSNYYFTSSNSLR